MSTEREVVKVTLTSESSAEEIARALGVLGIDDTTKRTLEGHLEKKLRIQILDRGQVNARLHVDLPPNLYGEWVNNDPGEIIAMRGRGFWVDEEYAPKRALHMDGNGRPSIGDCTFMVTSTVNKNLIDKIRMEEYARLNIRKTQKEEQDFQNLNSGNLGEKTTIIESKHAQVGGETIGNVLMAEHDKLQVKTSAGT